MEFFGQRAFLQNDGAVVVEIFPAESRFFVEWPQAVFSPVGFVNSPQQLALETFSAE